MPNEFDIRQSETRVLQDQLNATAVTGMDSTLASINKELTPVLRLRAASPNSRVINVQASTLANPNTGVNRSIAPITGLVPTFVSGTVTLPSADAGNIVTSTGGSTVMNCPSGQFVKVLIYLSSSGGVNTICGTPAGSSASAVVPVVPSLQLPVGYVVVQNVANVIQNIAPTNIYQFEGTMVAAPASGGSVPSLNYYDYTSTTLPTSSPYSPDGTPVVDGDTVLFTNLSSGNNAAYSVSGVGGTLTWTPLAIFNASATPTIGALAVIIGGTVFARQLLFFNGTGWEPKQSEKIFLGNSPRVERKLVQSSLLVGQTNTIIAGLSGLSNAIVSGFNIVYRLKSNTGVVSENTTFYTNTAGGFVSPITTPQVIIQQLDGKYLIGDAQLTSSAANNITRLNADGTRDSAFLSTLGSGFQGPGGYGVKALAQQPADGKLLIGGDYTSMNTSTRYGLVRLNLNGTEDTAFYTNLGSAFLEEGQSPPLSGPVTAIAVQADGKIVVGGQWSEFNLDHTQHTLLRLNSDGTVDTAFQTNFLASTVSGQTFSIAIQPDAKIIIGGQLNWNGNIEFGIVRLNSDGTVDNAFQANLGTGFSNPGEAVYVALQTDGKIVCGGQFTTFNGNARGKIARLNSDGTEDTAFAIASGLGFTGVSDFVNSVTIQPDGKIVTTGINASYDTSGVTAGLAARLNPDGTCDSAFGNGFPGGFNSAGTGAVSTNSTTVVVGNFTLANGTTRKGIFELTTDSLSRLGNLKVAVGSASVAVNDSGIDSSGSSGITFGASLSGSTVNITYSSSTKALSALFDVETFF